MDDNSLMPFGIHKGKALINVPADYLLFLYTGNYAHGELKEYIIDNLEVIKQEAALSAKTAFQDPDNFITDEENQDLQQ